MPVHLASNTGGTWLTTFSIAKSRKPIKNLSTGPSLLFFGRKIKAALVGIPALLGMPIFLSRRYAPVFEVEPYFLGVTLIRVAFFSFKRELLVFPIDRAKVCMAVCTPPRAAPNFTLLERKNGELPLTVTRRFTCVCGGEGEI